MGDRELLGLRPREWSVLQGAISAWSMVPNGHFLPPPGNAPSTRRLIDRGYLTKADQQTSPPHKDWIVVICTRENYERIVADLARAKAAG